MTVSNQVLVKEIGLPTVRVTFKKGAQNDIITISDSYNYVESRSSRVTIPLFGVENITCMVNGGEETFAYNYYEMTADTTASTDKRTVTFNATDLAALPTNVVLQNLTTGEYFVITSKNSSTVAFIQRGCYGTTPSNISDGDNIIIMNQIKLTSASTGFGTIICHEMPSPAYAQDMATND